MVENQKKIYLYDRWFEYQNKVEDKLVYYSIPKNISSQIRIEINTKTNEITLFYLDENTVKRKIEISDITKLDIELHYTDVVCEPLDIAGNLYDNIAIELFANIKNGTNSREYQIMFTKKDENSKFAWVDPILPINEKIDMNELDISSDKVDNFIEFVNGSLLDIKKLSAFLSVQETVVEEKESQVIKNVTIPQELIVYDRTYYLTNVTGNKITLRNDEDGIRNLEIKYDLDSLDLLSINLKIKNANNTKGLIQIKPNKLNGITVRYCNKKNEEISVGNMNIKTARIHSDMIFNSKGQKIETNVSISSKNEQLKLLEHPYIRNSYTDGTGDLYSIKNSGYNTFYGIASYATGIFNYIEKEVFKPKVLKKEESTEVL